MRDLAYYQAENVRLRMELASLLATRPDDPVAITHKRGQLLANLRHQHRLERIAHHDVEMNNLRNEIGQVTIDHRNQINARKSQIKREPNYHLGQDYGLTLRKVGVDFGRAIRSVDGEGVHNSLQLTKSLGAVVTKSLGIVIGVGTRAVITTIALGGFSGWKVAHHLWNGRRAKTFESTNRGKVMKKVSTSLKKMMESCMKGPNISL